MLKRAAYYTFGCKLNYAETSAIENYFLHAGINTVKTGENPDVVIINACSVTKGADRRCHNLIHYIKRKYPNTFLVVTGCYAQLYSENSVEIDKIDLLVGLKEKMNLLKYVLKKKKGVIVSSIGKTKFTYAYSYGNRTRSFLKIQDGCDYTCSYCIIPSLRGESRNGKISDIVKSVKKLFGKGVKEIVLTGVNIGDFGKSTGENFLNLLEKLDEVDSIGRFRISSIEPNLLSDEIIEFIASSDHFVPHFHIPLQSGSDTVLQLMRRKYDTELIKSKIKKIKFLMSDAFIGLDIIVGMRGENNECFNESQFFLENLPFSQLHVFPYSERISSKALSINQEVSSIEKNERCKKMIVLSEKKYKDFYFSQIGTKHTVLFENISNSDKMYGFTENYIKVETIYNKKAVNQLFNITLGGWNNEMTALTLNF
ncbi:MAG: tRNA (N(6)-L-threonylcarbamoyladenosine(37)-C(2))-methylthiotransferase MtaB [Bacteroidales bacterium OttesenSCG-928-I14]|jgi:threonylcarbamoyladenosine tRNA methylthiotransferase MtaB|nr:tRNA (N(6)-L-threonylcarbamoyladenosine(37)-C(2))-methylthiotransferase MtaB [Bacteroidales bacterium OttesenSCG-928-I14]